MLVGVTVTNDTPGAVRETDDNHTFILLEKQQQTYGENEAGDPTDDQSRTPRAKRRI